MIQNPNQFPTPFEPMRQGGNQAGSRFTPIPSPAIVRVSRIEPPRSMRFEPPELPAKRQPNDYSSGFVSGALTEPSRATGSAFYEDFELIKASDSEIRVKLGFVGFPVNASDVGPLPTGFSDGDEPPFVLSGISGTGYVYVHVEFDPDSDNATGLTVESDSTAPANDAINGYQIIGSYAVIEGVLYVAGATGSLNYLYCGGRHYFWVA